MRLTAAERTAIVACARAAFGATCTVRLFGSRADDRRRGGDIDLHIVADDDNATLEQEIAFRLALAERTEEGRVDVVLRGRSHVPGPIDVVALGTGVLLT